MFGLGILGDILPLIQQNDTNSEKIMSVVLGIALKEYQKGITEKLKTKTCLLFDIGEEGQIIAYIKKVGKTTTEMHGEPIYNMPELLAEGMKGLLGNNYISTLLPSIIGQIGGGSTDMKSVVGMIEGIFEQPETLINAIFEVLSANIQVYQTAFKDAHGQETTAQVSIEAGGVAYFEIDTPNYITRFPEGPKEQKISHLCDMLLEGSKDYFDATIDGITEEIEKKKNLRLI